MAVVEFKVVADGVFQFAGADARLPVAAAYNLVRIAHLSPPALILSLLTLKRYYTE